MILFVMAIECTDKTNEAEAVAFLTKCWGKRCKSRSGKKQVGGWAVMIKKQKYLA